MVEGAAGLGAVVGGLGAAAEGLVAATGGLEADSSAAALSAMLPRGAAVALAVSSRVGFAVGWIALVSLTGEASGSSAWAHGWIRANWCMGGWVMGA